LEEVDDQVEAPPAGEETERTESEDDSGPDEEIDWEAYLQDASDSGTVPTPERHEDHYEPVTVSAVTLSDLLRQQLYLKKLGPEDEAVLEFLLGSLDDRGYLTVSDEEIVQETGTEPERVPRLIGLIQECDPAGVGARDLRECLLIQLRRKGEMDSLGYRVVEQEWEALKGRRLPDIARALKMSIQAVQDAVDRIATLNPSPGGEVAGDDARYVYPDLVVERVGDDYVVSLNDRNVPRLRINRAYERVLLSQSSGDDKTRSFVKSKLKSARWIVQTIEQRRRTMVKVMSKIVEKQRAFFDHGVLHLKPLTLQDVAREIEMHESTVSRVTSGKYVQTPRGVFELKFFFSSGLGTVEGEDISSKAAKEKISRLIDKEEKRRPLSDQKIADLLKVEGVDIARRTVAKYREQMNIPTARLRKRH
jgi:RNA polymerase sigma-54 factor